MIEAIMAGGSIASNFLGNLFQNDQNRHLAHDMANRNSEEAFENRKWQERMSNTAFQRQKADMEAAGLNPLLGISGNGASTPGGATASGTAPEMENLMSGVVSSAIEAKTLDLAIKKQKEEVQNLQSQRKNTDAATKKTEVDARMSESAIKRNEAETSRAKVETQRARKDIPKAELINDIYDIGRPAVKKIKQYLQPDLRRR